MLSAYPDSYNHKRCISQWVAADTPVKIKVKATQGPNQRAEVTISDAHGNEYGKKKDLPEYDTTILFTTQTYGEVETCFRNFLDDGLRPDARYRVITFSIDTGSSTVDYKAIAVKEKLKPMEIGLRQMEGEVNDIINSMTNLMKREIRFRSTSESTNERVKNFSILTLFILVVAGVWQIFYLRNFFKSKKLMWIGWDLL